MTTRWKAGKSSKVCSAEESAPTPTSPNEAEKDSELELSNFSSSDHSEHSELDKVAYADDDVVSEIMVPIQEDPAYRDREDINPDDAQDPLDEDDMDEDEGADDEEQNRHVQISLKPEKSPLRL